MTINTTPISRLLRKIATAPATIMMMPTIQSIGTAVPWTTEASNGAMSMVCIVSSLSFGFPVARLRRGLQSYAFPVTMQAKRPHRFGPAFGPAPRCRTA